MLTLDLTSYNCLEQAEAYYKELTVDKHMEGVVIKPERWDGAVVPYMKVRNEQYLSIIYGYDYKFPHKYRKLMKQKSITKSLELRYRNIS